MKTNTTTYLSNFLKKEWEELWENSSSANMFNSPAWYVSALETFDYKNKEIITVRDSRTEKLVAIVPLIKKKIFGLSIFTSPAYEFIDHFILLGDLTNVEIVKEIVAEFLNLGTVCLNGFAERDTRLFGNKSEYIKIFTSDDNPYINFKSRDDGNLPAKNKSRSMRKANRSFGSVSFCLLTEDHQEAIRTAFDIDRRSSRNKKGKGVFHRESARKFFSLLAKENPKHFFVALLFFADKPVAYNIGFMNNGIYTCSQKAHLSKYDRYRPGGLAFKKFLEILAPEHPQEVDIGRGYDQFKMDFTKSVRILHGVIFSKNVFHRFYLSLFFQLKKRTYIIATRFPGLYKLYTKIKGCTSGKVNNIFL